MKFFVYKEEYSILSQLQKRKTNDFKSSDLNYLYSIETKTLLIILSFSIITTKFLLDKTSKETYISFRIGNISTYLTKEMVEKFNLPIVVLIIY